MNCKINYQNKLFISIMDKQEYKLYSTYLTETIKSKMENKIYTRTHGSKNINNNVLNEFTYTTKYDINAILSYDTIHIPCNVHIRLYIQKDNKYVDECEFIANVCMLINEEWKLDGKFLWYEVNESSGNIDWIHIISYKKTKKLGQFNKQFNKQFNGWINESKKSECTIL